jgi:hypothetical protein
MRSLIFELTLAATAAFAFGGTAWADDGADCKQIADPDRAIPACTNIIEAGQDSRDNLAIAHNNRGAAYEKKGDHDRAIAD